MSVTILHGDCLAILPTLVADSFDACVTDPPYHLTANKKGGSGAASDNPNSPAGRARITAGFMGKAWDGGDVAMRSETWAEVFRVLKPGAHLLCFGGTRTYHRVACAIEDAGFEIRDCIQWLYGSGFPKSHDVAKAIDKAARGVPHGGSDPTSANHGKYKTQATEGKRGETDTGQGFGAGPGQFMAEAGAKDDRELVADAAEWSGWGTALKPACEIICVARKPLIGTVAANVLQHGTGAMNIDGCRVPVDDGDMRSGGFGPGNRPWVEGDVGGNTVRKGRPLREHNVGGPDTAGKLIYGAGISNGSKATGETTEGRWPANVIHDGSEEVLAAFPDAPGQQRFVGAEHGDRDSVNCYGDYGPRPDTPPRGDIGSAARFFYTSKADATDRLESKHPTVKPVDLMRYLCRLVTQPGGRILDPFAGSGTTGMAAMAEGFRATLIEREAEYVADIRRRVAHVSGADAPLFAAGTVP